MFNWYSPDTFGKWMKRALVPRFFGLLLAVAALAVTEWRFDWVESAVGTYLISTNKYRPAFGAIWDQGRQADLARQTLSQYTRERRSAQSEARGATSLGQVLGSVDQQGAMISADHFIELYLKLPPVISREIVSPYELLSQMSSGQWQRTYFERHDENLSIYLLGNQNQVLQRISIGPELLEYVRRGEVAINSSLARLSDFAANIYPAERFFALLNSYPPEIRQGIVANPEDLLRASGRIVRVGISEQSAGAGSIDLGFEVDDAQGPKVILVQGREEDVRRLQRDLQSRAATSAAGGRQP